MLPENRCSHELSTADEEDQACRHHREGSMQPDPTAPTQGLRSYGIKLGQHTPMWPNAAPKQKRSITWHFIFCPHPPQRSPFHLCHKSLSFLLIHTFLSKNAASQRIFHPEEILFTCLSRRVAVVARLLVKRLCCAMHPTT